MAEGMGSGWGSIDVNIISGKAEGKVGKYDVAKEIAKVASVATASKNITEELIAIVKEAVNGVLKPVKTMVVGIMKLLAQLLRPISDMVVLLLMPILQFIRPIIKVFSDLMRPFRTAAYQLMRAANNTNDPLQKGALQSLAATSIITGLAVGLIGILGEFMKFILNIIVSLIGGLLDAIGLNGDKFVSKVSGKITEWVDTGVTTVQTLAFEGIKGLADTLGVNLNASIQSGINKAFNNIKIPEKFGDQTSGAKQGTNTQSPSYKNGGLSFSSSTGQGVSYADKYGGYSMADFPTTKTSNNIVKLKVNNAYTGTNTYYGGG